MYICSCSADVFYWPDLHNQCPKLLQREVIFERPHVKVKRGHIEIAVAEFGTTLIKCQNILSVVVTQQCLLVGIQIEMSAFAVDVQDFSLDSFVNFFSFLWGHVLHFALNTFLHFNTVFCLLADSYLVAYVNKRLYVIFEPLLMEAKVSLSKFWRDV